MKVPFVRDQEIERSATVLLDQFVHAHGRRLDLPIPVEILLETHLRLTLGFDDLHARFGVPQTGEDPDVLGALFVDEREVLINESLDPDVQPSQEGRFRFTIGHEIGHWELHRDLVTGTTGQRDLFAISRPAAIICRRSDESKPIERQANRFGAALLMPRDMVVDAWAGLFGDRHPRTIADAKEVWFRMRSLSQKFLVSTEAMRIRCEQLGLLYRAVPEQRFLRPVS